MLLTRSEVLALTGAREEELTRLEREGLIVPVRSWRNLWRERFYHDSQLAVIRWLVKSRRAEAALQARQARERLAP